jgi:hypothetical protein
MSENLLPLKIGASAARPPISHAKVIWLAGLASMLPLFLFWRSFHQLYFFHDDWELLSEAGRTGLWKWLFQPFLGESVIPVFKLLWLGAVRLFGGGYFAMICLLWATHLANCLLFGWLLARFHARAAVIAFAVLTFGLAWSNIETLGWSMQWSSQLALLFFLAAFHLLLLIPAGALGVAGYTLCLLASALSSTRGIVCGLALALFVLLMAADWKPKIRLGMASVIPAVLVILAMIPFLARHVGGWSLQESLQYGVYYFLLNPLYHLVSIHKETVGIGTLFFYGALKITALALGWRHAEKSLRPLLLVLMALDLANAVILGFGRHYTGLDTSVSSRYQYVSLFCFGPFAAQLAARPKRLAQAAIFLVWIPLLAYPWRRHAPRWAEWRGAEIRYRLVHDPDGAHFDPSSITAGQARELEKIDHLH